MRIKVFAYFVALAIHLLRSGCGSVGRAVAFNTIGPRFDSSHRQNLY